MEQDEIQQIEEEIAGLREGLDTELMHPPVSDDAKRRRAEWVRRSRVEIARLEALLPPKAGASAGGEST